MGFLKWIRSFLPFREKKEFQEYENRLFKRASEIHDEGGREFLEKAPIDEKMKLMSEEAKKYYELDYNPESLKQLDQEFCQLENEYDDAEIINPSTEQELDEMMAERPDDFEYSSKLGVLQNQSIAYLGETLRREFEGEWVEKDFSDALERARKTGMKGGHAGISIPLGEEFYFVNVPNLVNKRLKGDKELYEIYKSVSEDVAKRREKPKALKNSFGEKELRKNADNISEGLKLSYDSKGIKKLDKVLMTVNYETDVDDVDKFILEVGCFLSVVLEKELDIETENIRGELIVVVPETELKMRLMEIAEKCVRNKQEQLYETYAVLEGKIDHE